MGGIIAARGRYVIMGDADDSYDFTALMPFVEALRDGADLVMGNRFKGGVAPGAMPSLHRYLGNPVLSFIGRLFFRSKIGDFHCGLRGFRRDSVLALGLQATGMEFASEMVVKATLARQRIEEVPTTLSPDGRSRPPHLRSWRDGWRHLRFLLLFSPRWLFLYPGAALLALGLIIGAAITPGPLTIGSVSFDVDTLVGASAMIVIGFQVMQFGLFTKLYASAEGFMPGSRRVRKLLSVWSLERGLVFGGLLLVAGIVGVVVGISDWHVNRFGALNPTRSLRLIVPSATALVVGCQLIFGSFFMSILGIKRTRHPATGAAEAAPSPAKVAVRTTATVEGAEPSSAATKPSPPERPASKQAGSRQPAPKQSTAKQGTRKRRPASTQSPAEQPAAKQPSGEPTAGTAQTARRSG
jgi:hypothetical protein